MKRFIVWGAVGETGLWALDLSHLRQLVQGSSGVQELIGPRDALRNERLLRGRAKKKAGASKPPGNFEAKIHVTARFFLGVVRVLKLSRVHAFFFGSPSCFEIITCSFIWEGI